MKILLVIGLLLALYTITATADYDAFRMTNITCDDGKSVNVGPKAAQLSREFICQELR